MIAPRNRAVIVDEIGGGSHAELVTVGHHVMRADKNEAVGGRDTGPSPYEYLMAGLGACTADRCPVSQTLQRSSVVVSLLVEGPLSADP